MNTQLRNLPKVDDVLSYMNQSTIPHGILVACIRDVLATYRTAIKAGKHENASLLSVEDIAQAAQAMGQTRMKPTLQPVINGTGIVLHTNLGRAPMPEAVAQHVKDVAMGYATLEYSLETGRRGSRTKGIENALTQLTNAPAACIVNNNAAAMLLALSALCANGHVVVSRGELVEIGGSFRIPEVIAGGGAILHEVGTTNKTHPQDYQNAIDPATAALLKVHTSNYKVMGFTQEVSLTDMVNIARENNVLSIYDLGSGSFEKFGTEPTVPEAVATGVDILCFSGDKLLGGPQCGIILGSEQHMLTLRAHPLYRALRADKLTLAALEATLNIYQDMPSARAHIPTLHMLLSTPDDLREKAAKLLALLPPTLNATLESTQGLAGGGSLPLETFSSWAVAIPRSKNATPESLERHLRHCSPPIIGRVHMDTLLLDVRTIPEKDFEVVARSLSAHG